MRKVGILLGCVVIGLLVVGMADGQQQPKKKFGGFGGFGGGGGFANNPVALLQNEQVKKELEVSEDQLEKLPAALDKAVAEVLNENQLKRFKQIQLQTRGNSVFTDPKVTAVLKISDEQVENIKSILQEAGKERQEIFKEAQGDFKAAGEKAAALDKETKEKVQGVLSADQRKQWKQMIGAEFKLEQQGFGGFGNFKKKQKKDAE